MDDPTSAEFLAELLAMGPAMGVRYPHVEYNPDGDQLEITLEPGSYYGKWIPPGAVTELRDHEDNRLVGLIIHGVSKRTALKALTS